MTNKFSPGDSVTVDAGLGITKVGNVQRIDESTVFVKHYNGAVVGYRAQHVTKVLNEQVASAPRGVGLKSEFEAFALVVEKKLTPAELKKREEVATAMERENPDMPMDKKMAIATATAKKVAEEVEMVDGRARVYHTHSVAPLSHVKKAKESLPHKPGKKWAFDTHGQEGKRPYMDFVHVKEEVEQIDELSKKTTMSYLVKAGKDLDAGSKTPEKRDKRIDGYFAAGKRLSNEKPTSEGKAHTVPKTPKEKSLASLAHPKDKITHADVMIGRGVKKEEAELDEEQLDELSKDTLKSYGSKADRDADVNMRLARQAWEKGDKEKDDMHFIKGMKRQVGVDKASARLSKEEAELDEEQLDELSKHKLSSYVRKASGDAAARS
jgi:hypothetical protein